MKQLRFRCGVAALASLSVLAIACDRTSSYRIGVVLDADGIRGASFAAQAINSAGGIHGHRLELVTMPGASTTSASVALTAAERVASDPTVLAVVGHTNSSASLAASQVYNAKHVTQIAPTTTTPLYSRAGPYSFRLVASDEHQGLFLAKQVLRQSPRTRTAVIFVNDDYGRALAAVVIRELHAAGRAPAYSTPYTEHTDGFQDHAEVVGALSRARPDLLIWVGRAVDFSQIALEIRAALPNLSVLASDGFGGPALSQDSLHTLTGVRYVRLVDYSRPNTALARLMAQYRNAGFGELTDQASLAYDAVLLLAQAMRERGRKRDAIREWVASVGRSTPPFPGVTGPIAFPTGGDRAPVYVLAGVPTYTPRESVHARPVSVKR